MQSSAPAPARANAVEKHQEGIMLRRSLFTGTGSLALAAGIGLRLSFDTSFTHFASGFLLGVSIALLILGLSQPSRRVSR
jgi:hypothetical protein